jgi:hypothetical protein
MELLEVEKKNLKKAEFTNNYDEKNLIDLNKTGIIKKRKREDVESICGNDNLYTGKLDKITENGVVKIITVNPNIEEKNEGLKEIHNENSKENN